MVVVRWIGLEKFWAELKIIEMCAWGAASLLKLGAFAYFCSRAITITSRSKLRDFAIFLGHCFRVQLGVGQLLLHLSFIFLVMIWDVYDDPR